MNKVKNRLNQRLTTIFIVLSIVLIAFLAYNNILGYFFTGLDSLNLIETSRIQSFSDVIRIFTSSMTGEFSWYRPIAVLSYSLDYSIWKLNPFGYQLTNLILHILVSVLAFFFIRVLSNKRVTALLGAIIFTVHPILMEDLPAPARRVDIIVTLFILSSLLLFLKYFSTVLQKRGYLFFSLFFYALALGTKEIAVILPPMVFTYVMIFLPSSEKSFKDRVIPALKGSLPYFIVTIMYLAFRTYVLKGIGGYEDKSSGIFTVFRLFIDIVINYFADLVYPVDFLRLDTLFSISPTTLQQIFFLFALFAFSIFLFLYRQTILRVVNHKSKRVVKTFKTLLLITAILSVMVILVYPFLFQYISLLIQRSYKGEGVKLFTEAMENRGVYPVEIYLYKARDLILYLSLVLLFSSSIFLIGIYQHDKLKNFFISTYRGGVILFLLIWVLLPFGVYLLTQTFDHHDMYISAFFFSAILSVIVVESFQSTIQKIREKISVINSSVMSFIITTVLSVSLLLYSPLVRTYGEWKDSGDITKIFLHKLSKILPELPNNAVINIYNFPNGISSYEAQIPHAKEVAYIADFSIKAWLDLNYPSNQMEVIIHSKTKLAVYPDTLDLEVKKERNNNVSIIIKTNYERHI